MLLAEITAEGWVIIIGSATVGLTTLITSVVNLILGHLERVRQAERAVVQDKKLTTIVRHTDDMASFAQVVAEGQAAVVKPGREQVTVEMAETNGGGQAAGVETASAPGTPLEIRLQRLSDALSEAENSSRGA